MARKKSRRNSNGVFQEEIIKTVIGPKLATTIRSFEGGHPPSTQALCDEFNKQHAVNVSVATVKGWLKLMGIGIRVRPVLVQIDLTTPAPVRRRTPSAPQSALTASQASPTPTPQVTGDFEKPPVMGNAAPSSED